jgi:tetrapyrrole methylase family protein / MazG family protein
MEKTKKEFEELININKRLRKECPWDKEQTLESFYNYIVEEAIEVKQAAKSKDYEELKEELGDVFWNVLFMANIAEEKNLFTLHDVIATSKEKMIRRHPHVFGDASKDVAEIEKTWQKIKAEEKKEKEERKKNGTPNKRAM